MRYGLILVWLMCLTAVLWGLHPVFSQQDALLLMLMPLTWAIFYQWLPMTRPDARVLTPKNVVLFIWFNKLVVIPLEIIFLGNHTPQLVTRSYPIFTEVLVVLVSYGAFWTGWRARMRVPLPERYAFDTGSWALGYMATGLLSLVVLYGSLKSYWEGAIFTYVTRETLEQWAGSLWGLLANVGQRFWAFGVMLAWMAWPIQRADSVKSLLTGLCWLLLCLSGSLSSNRSNMLFPLLTFLSLLLGWWWLRHKWWLVTLAIGGLLLSFFYGYLRTQPSLDTQQLALLFDEYWNSPNHYILYAHQLYFGTPYQITPLLSIDSPSPTLWASILDPIPLLGKAFREESGPYVYNTTIQSALLSQQDKVIPMAGELYFNGGLGLVVLGYWVFGRIHRWWDEGFKTFAEIQWPLAAAFFYLSLLFNATLLLSLTVLVQLFFYNALPALLLMVGSYWQNFRKLHRVFPQRSVDNVRKI